MSWYTESFVGSKWDHKHLGTKRRVSSETEAEQLGGAAFSSQGWSAFLVLTTSGSTDGRKINRREAALTSCGYKQVLRLHSQANLIISLDETLKVQWVQLPAAAKAVLNKVRGVGQHYSGNMHRDAGIGHWDKPGSPSPWADGKRVCEHLSYISLSY